MGAEQRRIEIGFVAPELAEELAGLAIAYIEIPRGSGRSPRELKRRLRELSDRFGGRQAIALRQRPIPSAYRVFYRHIGLDPDEQPTPVEAVALERMKKGGFVSRNLLDDALTLAMIETGVALRAFDPERIEGRLGIRLSREGELLAGRPGPLPPGTLTIADARGPVGLLFGATASGAGVTLRSRGILLGAIQVAGVPAIAVEEALWLAGGAIESV